MDEAHFSIYLQSYPPTEEDQPQGGPFLANQVDSGYTGNLILIRKTRLYFSKISLFLDRLWAVEQNGFKSITDLVYSYNL